MADEYYTKYSDIEEELAHYKEHFRDKIIYCNCDDYRKSNFYKYFKNNFDALGLKKLITSCHYKRDLFDQQEDLGSITTCNGTEEFRLGSGDFRGQESIELLKHCDIVVTNPPFSIWKSFLDQLCEYDKKFLILGVISSISSTTATDMILDGKMWLGKKRRSTTEFIVPSTTKKYDRIEDGIKYASIGNATWYTNLSYDVEYPTLNLECSYDPEKHKRYENYDAINVDKVKDIPNDYDGPMGVPVTYLFKHNPDHFKMLDVFNDDLLVDGKLKYIRIIIQRNPR